MTSKVPIQGPGHFQWNKGGWFGSQLGGTAWSLTAALMCVAAGSYLGGIGFLVAFLVPNALGTWLWRQRDRIMPYPAIMALLAVCLLCVLLGFGSLDLYARVQGGHGSAGGSFYRSLLVLSTGLIGGFSLMEWAGRRARSKPTVSKDWP